MRVTIEQILDDGLPPIYAAEDFRQRCDVVYEHVFDKYTGAGRGIYTAA